MNALQEPLRINGCELRNRLYRAPVLEGAGDGPDAPTIYAEAFGANARAGVGLIIQGNSCTTAEGRSSPGMTLVHTRASTLRLQEATGAVHRHGGRIWLQTGGAGIYAMEGWHALHAAARRHPLTAVSKPRIHVRPALQGVPLNVLSTTGVRDLIGTFADSAEWAQEAGYDGVQLASSNAKLIHQFLSPYYNRRTDEFGGSLYRDEDQAVVERVAAVAAAREVPRAQVALAWLLAQPAVTSPIVGVTQRAHLDDAVAAVDLELSTDELAELGAGYVPHAIAGHR